MASSSALSSPMARLQQLLADRLGAGRHAVEADRQHGVVGHHFVEDAHMRHHVAPRVVVARLRRIAGDDRQVPKLMVWTTSPRSPMPSVSKVRGSRQRTMQ